MKQTFQMMAAYNRWANRRLYAEAAKLSDKDYREDHGAFFGSLHGTLNHLLVGDRLWMYRITGEGDAPARLDDILYDDLKALEAAREKEDECIASFVDSLADADMERLVTYRTISHPKEIRQVLGPLLMHVFNHQTHHRGQAHCILTRITGTAPSLDLLLYQRETGTSIVDGKGGDFSAPQQRA